MGVWQGRIYFADRRGRSTMNINFPNAAGIFDGAEFTAVKGVVSSLATALNNASEARVGHAVIFYEEPVDVIGLSATVDRRDTLSLTAYLTSTGPSGNIKTWSFGIPAPVEAILGPDANSADLNDALLQSVMTELSDAQTFGMRVSDGEQIDFTLGAQGLKSGDWISKKGS